MCSLCPVDHPIKLLATNSCVAVGDVSGEQAMGVSVQVLVNTSQVAELPVLTKDMEVVGLVTLPSGLLPPTDPDAGAMPVLLHSVDPLDIGVSNDTLTFAVEIVFDRASSVPVSAYTIALALDGPIHDLNDMCLSYWDDSLQMWTCVDDGLTLMPNGWLIGSTTHNSIFSITRKPTAAGCTSAGCQGESRSEAEGLSPTAVGSTTMWIFIACGVAVLALALLVVLFVIRRYRGRLKVSTVALIPAPGSDGAVITSGDALVPAAPAAASLPSSDDTASDEETGDAQQSTKSPGASPERNNDLLRQLMDQVSTLSQQMATIQAKQSAQEEVLEREQYAAAMASSEVPLPRRHSDDLYRRDSDAYPQAPLRSASVDTLDSRGVADPIVWGDMTDRRNAPKRRAPTDFSSMRPMELEVLTAAAIVLQRGWRSRKHRRQTMAAISRRIREIAMQRSTEQRIQADLERVRRRSKRGAAAFRFRRKSLEGDWPAVDDVSSHSSSGTGTPSTGSGSSPAPLTREGSLAALREWHRTFGHDRVSADKPIASLPESPSGADSAASSRPMSVNASTVRVIQQFWKRYHTRMASKPATPAPPVAIAQRRPSYESEYSPDYNSPMASRTGRKPVYRERIEKEHRSAELLRAAVVVQRLFRLKRKRRRDALQRAQAARQAPFPGGRRRNSLPGAKVSPESMSSSVPRAKAPAPRAAAAVSSPSLTPKKAGSSPNLFQPQTVSRRMASHMASVADEDFPSQSPVRRQSAPRPRELRAIPAAMLQQVASTSGDLPSDTADAPASAPSAAVHALDLDGLHRKLPSKAQMLRELIANSRATTSKHPPTVAPFENADDDPAVGRTPMMRSVSEYIHPIRTPMRAAHPAPLPTGIGKKDGKLRQPALLSPGLPRKAHDATATTAALMPPVRTPDTDHLHMFQQTALAEVLHHQLEDRNPLKRRAPLSNVHRAQSADELPSHDVPAPRPSVSPMLVARQRQPTVPPGQLEAGLRGNAHDAHLSPPQASKFYTGAAPVGGGFQRDLSEADDSPSLHRSPARSPAPARGASQRFLSKSGHY